MDMAGEGEGETIRESSPDICALTCEDRELGEAALQHGKPARACDDLESWGGGRRGRLTSEGMLCLYMAHLACCAADTCITAL